ncbi:MAG: hypothetical protein O2904_03780 [bacterium]|nr:hypothetical protein [bacterium]
MYELFSSIAELLSPVTALALFVPSPEDIMNQVSNGLGTTVAGGGENVGEIAFSYMSQIRPLMYGVAGLIILITGLMLAITQDEGQLATARKTLFAAIASLILVTIADVIFQAFTGTTIGGVITVSGPTNAGGALLATELLGLINFIEVPIGTIAILMIIVSGIRAVVALGTETGTQQLRRTVISVIAGLVLISSKILIANTFGVSGPASPTAAIGQTLGYLRTIVSFMALAAVVMIVIAGMYMVMNKGDAEAVSKAKGLIIRTLIGLVVIAVSYNIFLVLFT